MNPRRASIIGSGLALVLLLALAGLWLARARLVEEFARDYFRRHGIAASVEVGSLGFSGATGRFALGPADAPELAARKVELFFDPLRWKPYLVEVRLTDPVVRARIDEQGRVTLPSLQAWLESLGQSKEKSPYVSDDLAVSFTGLRAFLATPGGMVEVDGDAKLARMQPVSAALTLKPGALRWRGISAHVESGTLTLAQTSGGYRLAARLAGDVARGDMAAVKLAVAAETPLLRLDGGAVVAAALQVNASAQQVRGGGVTADAVQLALDAKDVRFANGILALADGTARARAASLDGAAGAKTVKLDIGLRNVTASARGVAGDGDLALEGDAVLPEALRRTIHGLPVLAMDARLKAAVSNNLGPFAVAVKAKMARHGDATTFKLTAPLTVRATKGAVLRVSSLSAAQKGSALSGSLHAALSGGGLPPLRLAANDFVWNGETLRAPVALTGKLDFAAFRSIDAKLDGMVTAGKGAFAFALSRCEKLTLAELGALATKITTQICPAKTPLFVLDGAGWRAVADAKAASAFLPLANADLREAAAHLSFDGKAGPRGSVTVTAATVSDAARPLRFNPVAGSGTVTLAEGIWRGRFAVSDTKGHPLGTATLTHAMADGQGSAHIAAALNFAQDGLQPEDLSPLLAALRKADGRADFAGDIAWTARGLAANTGTLAVKDFAFLTPMGRAHALDTRLALTSLLPPATAPGQELKIARIDWTLPATALDLRFGYDGKAVAVDGVEGDIAEGHVALAPFVVNLGTVTPGAPAVASRAAIAGLSLAPLIAASNLSGKASLQGKLSGTIPFTAGPEGLRIKDGHLKADGPGRLELSRSLWGESAATANAVQDFAYQALESLAFDTLTADIDSIAGGRLKIVFHIKGRSDPPKPQVAEVALSDIINGSALQKPIPLPSGTPIDLTLDTSLNFDELLRSYTEAWSKALNGSGADSR
jgi:hypothetical protein